MAFLLIVFLAGFVVDVWVLRTLFRSLKQRRKMGQILMSLGAVLFIGAVQFACLTILLTHKSIGLWPNAYLRAMQALAYSGIALVVSGIIANISSLFR